MKNKKTQFNEILPLITESLSKGEKVVFSPYGESMLPLLRPGRDSVELSCVTDKIKRYDIVFFQRYDGTFVLHRVIKSGDILTIAGDNRIYEEEISEKQLIGVVSSFERNGKKYVGKKMISKPYLTFVFFRRFLRKAKNKILSVFIGRN